MTESRLKYLLRLALVLLLILLFLSGCVSRYKIELFQSIDETRRKTKVEESAFIEGVVIGDPLAERKFDRGNGNCLVLTTSFRGEALKTQPTETLFIGFFENLRCKLYLQLPSQVKPQKIELESNALVQMMGRYEIPLEDKIFLPVEGSLVIDSIVDARTLFGEVNGRFVNHLEQEIAYDGQFKVKIAD